MKEFIKEVFSLENLKKAMVMQLLSNANLTKSDYLYFSSIMDTNNTINEEIKIKKAS